MKNLFNNSLLLIISALILSGSSFKNDEDIDEIKKEIEKLNIQFCNSWINDDLESYLSIYTDDAVVMPPFSPIRKGKQALRRGWEKQRAEGVKYLSASTTILELWTSGNMVYERGSYGITLKPKNSNQPYSIYGSYFSIWVKQNDGSYKMKYDISNLDHNI